MRGIDGNVIIDLRDGIDTQITSPLTSIALSTTNENDTRYTLFPININQTPIIVSGILNASEPPIKSIQAASSDLRILYINADNIVRIAANERIVLKIQAIQPNIPNVENGIPQIIPPTQGLIYTWKRDGNVLINDGDYTIVNNTLTIKNTDPTLSGLYSCDVSNDIGTTSSEEVEFEIVDIEADPFFYQNHIENPIAADDTDSWVSSIGNIEAKKLSNTPTYTYKKVNNVNNFGYTVDMFYPRPYQLNYYDINNYDINNLVTRGGYFTRPKLNYYINGETTTVSAYQDIDLTDIQDYIQNTIYGVRGVRAVFSCYIGNAVSRFRHTTGFYNPYARLNAKNYQQNSSRLSLDNMSRAGLPEINESAEVVIEEYNGYNQLPINLYNQDTTITTRVSRISLLDPWTKAKNANTINQDAFIRVSNILNTLYGSEDLNRYTLGQYVEHNKVVINKLNFETNKIRIRLNFICRDPRLVDVFEEFTSSTDELYDVVSWEPPTTAFTPAPNNILQFDGNASMLFRLQQDKPNVPILRLMPKNGLSRTLITGLNLNLIPITDQDRVNYYTNNIGSPINNQPTIIPNQL